MLEKQTSQAYESIEIDKTKKIQMPHTYIILVFFSAIAALMTYLIPAGEFKRIPGPDGRETIDPSSYRLIESQSNSTDLMDFMLAIPKGLIAAGDIVFFTFIIGGLFSVLRKTGIIEMSVDTLTRKFSKNGIFVIPTLMVVFASLATLIGTQELSLVYIPIILPIMIALGFDSVVAAAVALTATTAGFTAGIFNPINTGLGQKLSGLPLWSGIGFRSIIFMFLLGTAIIYIMSYAKKVKNNPKYSLVYEEDAPKRAKYRHTDSSQTVPVTTRQKMALAVTLVFLGILVYGVVKKSWFMVEMSGLFIMMGVVIGLIAGLKASEICEGFNEGFRDVLMGAIIVGVARSISIIMSEGKILDTIVLNLGQAVGDFPPALSALGMFLVQMVMSFVVSSGSGQALVTLPIMAPLSDLVGVTRQTAVLAYQLGDGPGNILFPTSGYYMAAIALAGVSIQKWVRFYFPLFLIWVGGSAIFLIVAQLIKWNG